MNLLGQRKWWWLGFSAFIAFLGLVSLLIWQLKIGLDFTGGTLFEVTNQSSSQTTTIMRAFKADLKDMGLKNITVQQTNDNGILVKAATIDQPTHRKLSAYLKNNKQLERRFENVGPTVGKDLTRKAIMAVVIASVAIILYIAYSFRNVPRPASSWRFGVTAILALVHDIFITIGIYALLGHFLGYEVDALFITALLTIMGFSVHDTIVVFDRLRENMRLSPISKYEQFETVANDSLIQTLNRSLNTSLTVMLVLLSMALLGGATIRPFIVTLLIGVSVGTYSSIATATPLLIIWQGLTMRRAAR